MCRRCFKFWGPMERDHVWPKKWGGPDARWNYQRLCRRCNRRKGARWADYRLRNLVLALMLGWVLLYGW
jgi:5-methylcytosine-specific restriction endonuclease McrA